MSLPTVRTITLGISVPHPIPPLVIEEANTLLQQAVAVYSSAGYSVQTVRLSTRPLLSDLVGWSPEAIRAYVAELQRILTETGLAYCSLGTVLAAQPDFPLERLDLVADLLIENDLLSMTVQMATPVDGLRTAAAVPIARIVQRLAHETVEGFGNFRFAMLACVDPGSPFFPTAYHDGPTSLSIGLQGASLVTEVLRSHIHDSDVVCDLNDVTEWVRSMLIEQATPVVRLGERIAQEHAIQFGGIDLSPAPMAEESIVTALELCGYGSLGSAGTLAVTAALTSALKSTGLPMCGYCGLMLPVLEDAVLGRRWEEGGLSIHQLLVYSAVCGTGLDTIPLAGDSSAEMIAHILLDVATLALRMQKPLSARLFPVPGRRVGERTAFSSPYMINTSINA